ncbi:MAG TPA: M20/M25/M40 family metallo-hydrolase [Thermoanaerobaculia bacterium]|nr:M20/M25/M40 family metallo-hydrolase [Thermoanaerobaculia bacterium]
MAGALLAPDVLPEPIFRRTLDLLVELTAISSPSDDPGGLRRMAGRLAAEMSARGLTPEIREEEGEGGIPLPVLAGRGPGTGRGHLLLIGHLDTVLPAAAPRVEGDRLVATGAIDMKGGLAAFLGALDLLRHRGVEPPPDLLLAIVPDEEVGGVLSRAAIHRWSEGARALWVLEPGEPAGEGAETMVAGRRGMFQWTLAARGRAAHSGLHYWHGRSALIAAAGWCVEAEAHSARDGGPTVNVGRFVGGDTTFVEGLASHHALLGTEQQLNVVPDRAYAEGEARFLRATEGERLAGVLETLAQNIAKDTETELSLEIGPTIPPVDPDGPHASWCERAVSLAAARGWRLEIERERGGISFPNFLADPGRIPVLDGLGPVGGGMHTREEHVMLASLQRRIVLLADLLAVRE